MVQPTISIIIPTYNRAHLLPRAIESVLYQEADNWQLIVVNDGSTDNTREVVNKYGDQRIKYIYQTNSDLSHARNTGMKASDGAYFCFLDDDDTLHSRHTKAISDTLDRLSETHILLTGTEVIHGSGRSHSKMFTGAHEEAIRFVWQNQCPGNAFIFPAALKDMEQFDERFVLFEDKHFVMRALLHFPLRQVPAHTYVYHPNRESRSARAYRDLPRLQNQLDCIADLFDEYGDQLIPHLGPHAARKRQAQSLLEAAHQALRKRCPGLARKHANHALRLDKSPRTALRTLNVWLKALTTAPGPQE